MSNATILDAGTPLAGAGSTAPLWISQCDASSNQINTLAPAPVNIPIVGANGTGTRQVETQIENLDQIEQVNFTGTLRGKYGDTITLNLVHETLGKIPLLTNHTIQGPLSTAYPLPAEVRTFLFGESIPTGYVFAGFTGNGIVQTTTLPENINPNNYYYYSNYYSFYAGFSWQVINYTPGASPYLLSVQVHRYPYAPDYNYDNAPSNSLVTGAVPLVIIFRGFRYIMQSSGSAEPSIIRTQTFTNLVIDTNASSEATFLSVYQPTQWGYFINGYSIFGGADNNTAFSETLYSNYGAHDWVVTGVTRSISKYMYVTPFGLTGVAYRVVDTYTVSFLYWQPIVWSVQALAQATWQAIFPPSARWQFYPPDYYDYLSYAERSETLSITSLDWKGLPADGRWALEYIATSANVPVTAYPTVSPSIINISGGNIQIVFKGNDPYVSAAIVPTTPSAGVTQAYAQANLRANGKDRSFIGILCGINGSTTMGILCCYSVLRIGRTGEIYNVSYLLSKCCNINNVNSIRNVSEIAFWGENWGDRPFSTRGDAGEAFVQGSSLWRNYPVRGQLGLTVKVTGNRLDFFLNGIYPVLTFIDPTVALVTSFNRVSLNA